MFLTFLGMMAVLLSLLLDKSRQVDADPPQILHNKLIFAKIFPIPKIPTFAPRKSGVCRVQPGFAVYSCRCIVNSYAKFLKEGKGK